MARWFIDRSPQQGIPSVSLRRLLPDARFLGCTDLLVSGCSADSRRLDPGQVFVAVQGSRHDGHQFVGRALERGAAGVVVERPCPEAGPLQVVVPDSREALARLCHALAGEPSSRLRLIAIAGQSRGSATALFLRSILEAAGERVGYIGSLGWCDGATAYPPGAMGLRAESLAEMLAAMVERGCESVLLEMSAEDLLRRVGDGLSLDAAIITDLHHSRPSSLNERVEMRRLHSRLCRRILPEGATVVNADDP